MSKQLLLAEELFLLTHHDASGKSNGTAALDNGLAGALLLDLATESLLAAKGKTVIAVPGTPAHPLLAAAHDTLLAAERHKVLKLFPTTVWPTVDSGPEKLLRAQLAAVLVDDTTPPARVALLIALLHPLELAGTVVDKPHRTVAKARAKAIAEDSASSAAVSGAVGQAVRAVQAAVLTSVFVTTVGTTGTT